MSDSFLLRKSDLYNKPTTLEGCSWAVGFWF